MSRDKPGSRLNKMPVEKHDTAAWANIMHTKNCSRITMPGRMDMENAKEWVDTNQK